MQKSIIIIIIIIIIIMTLRRLLILKNFILNDHIVSFATSMFIK